MTSNWDLAAVHGLNRFLWSKLKTDLAWSEANYGGLVPIIPSQQEPEFTALDKPFIVYTYGMANPGPDWWLEIDMATYTIYSNDEEEVRSTLHYIRDLLSRYDDSAHGLNDYLDASGSTQQRKFDYKFIHLTGGNGPLAATEEAGRHSAMLVFRIIYTHTRAGLGMRT